MRAVSLQSGPDNRIQCFIHTLAFTEGYYTRALKRPVLVMAPRRVFLSADNLLIVSGLMSRHSIQARRTTHREAIYGGPGPSRPVAAQHPSVNERLLCGSIGHSYGSDSPCSIAQL